jgi:Uncharacterized protein, possibly involved in utilization of glycolate and propanediol
MREAIHRLLAGTVLWLALPGAAFAAPAASAPPPSEPLMVPVMRLSMDEALKAARASIQACRKLGYSVAVTVVDRSGHPEVMLRDTLAMDLAIPVSRKKAYTAMTFNMPTSKLVGRFPGAYSVPKVRSVLVSPGAVPIDAAGQILGGIGVSGTPSGTTDERCARAGRDAILPELEMAGP